MIKLVALDMDGTLLDSEKRAPADFADWVREHKEIRTVLASGRQYYTLERQFDDLKDCALFVAENGAIVYNGDEVIYENSMDPKAVEGALEVILGLPGAIPIMCGVGSAYIAEASKEAMTESAKYYARLKFVEDLHEYVHKDRFLKIAVFFAGRDAERAYNSMPELPEGVSPLLSGDRWIDVANDSIGKGEAINKIRIKYGLEKDECMAFGDYLNDMSMILECGQSYAMKNAHEDIKRAAKYVTEYDNDNDGVMRVLRNIRGLKETV